MRENFLDATRNCDYLTKLMYHGIDELRALARAYIAATGVGPTTLSRLINGAPNSRAGSEKLIARLLAGHACLMPVGERASRWFTENWPEGVPWPPDVPRNGTGGPRDE